MKTSYRIENIIATVILEHTLDLELIESLIPSIIYKPEQFPGLIFRLESPRSTALIFKSGKIVVIGIKSTQQLIEAVKRIIRTLNRYGIKISGRLKVWIQNIVARGDIHAYINLEKASYQLKDSIYEPEQFPGLIHRMEDPRVVLLIFSSGKLVITGARDEEEVKRAVKQAAKTLWNAGCIVEIKEE